MRRVGSFVVGRMFSGPFSALSIILLIAPFTDAQQTSGLALDVNKNRKAQVQVGDVAAKYIEGNFSSGDWIKAEKKDFDDKIMLVVYWSLDDVNREQWESKLRDIRTTYLKNPDFRILSICVSTDWEAWMKYLDQAPSLDVDGHKVKVFCDRIWWQAHVLDWKPPEAVVDKSQLPTAHLIGKDGRFIAVRVPLKDLVSTVAANVHEPYSHAPPVRGVQSATGEQTVWTDPATAATENRSFRLQGEYLGIGQDGKRYGVQVRSADHWRRGTNVWYIEQGVLGDLYEANGKTTDVGGFPGLSEKGDTKFICSMSGTWHDDGASISTGEGEYEAKIKGNKLELYDPLYERGKKPIAILPRVARENPTLGAKPPERAVVLFDGNSADAWINGRVEDGILHGKDMRTKQAFRDYQLHLEFRTPYILPQVKTTRPTSLAPPQLLAGVFHQGQYETQIRDSFCCGYFFEQAGTSLVDACCAINRIAPRVNACLPSLVWQTYDAEFTAARFDGTGKLTQAARITDRLNGVVVHNNLHLSEKSSNAPIAEPVLISSLFI